MKAVPAVLLLAVTIYAVVDCLRTDDALIKSVPKPLWLVAILIIPMLGPIAWLVAGKLRPEEGVFYTAEHVDGPRPLAPDDDPAFLRKLSDQQWTERRRRQREMKHFSPDEDDEPPAGQATAS